MLCLEGHLVEVIGKAIVAYIFLVEQKVAGLLAVDSKFLIGGVSVLSPSNSSRSSESKLRSISPSSSTGSKRLPMSLDNFPSLVSGDSYKEMGER